jgi:predicted tellurium resistance membrane protein TerC
MESRPFSILDGVALAAIGLLVLGYFATDNVLQEIEVVVLGCFVALVYIALQLRLRSPN